MDETIVVAGIVLAVIVGALTVAVVTQRERLKRLDAKFGLDGVGLSIELHEMIKSEVARISLAALGRMARLDAQLVTLWEKGRVSSEEASDRISLFESEITELEQKLESEPPQDKYWIAMRLRELYWDYLRCCRELYASSGRYNVARGKVMGGLAKMEAISGDHPPQVTFSGFLGPKR